MLKTIGLSALLLYGTVAAADAATCRISRFEFVFGSDASSQVVAKSGQRCDGHINGRSAISGGSVVQQAAHGTAFVDGHQFGYQSQPGYSGPDAFVIGFSGTSYRRGRSGSYALDGSTNISFAVQVVR